MTAEQILVIILASALALFLILGIVLVSYLIVIAKKLNRVASIAERTVDHVEGFVASAQRAIAPAALGNMFMDVIDRFTNRRKK